MIYDIYLSIYNLSTYLSWSEPQDRSVAESERSVDSAELSDDAPSDMTEFDAPW